MNKLKHNCSVLSAIGRFFISRSAARFLRGFLQVH